MPVVNCSVVVPAPRDEVFSYAQDYLRRPQWDRRVRRAYTVGDSELGQGAIVRYVFKGLVGTSFWAEVNYIVYRPPIQSAIKQVRSSFSNPYVEAAGSWHFDEVEGGTRFTTRFSYTLGWGVLGRLLDRLVVERVTIRETKQSLENLRRRFEASVPERP